MDEVEELPENWRELVANGNYAVLVERLLRQTLGGLELQKIAADAIIALQVRGVESALTMTRLQEENGLLEGTLESRDRNIEQLATENRRLYGALQDIEPSLWIVAKQHPQEPHVSIFTTSIKADADTYEKIGWTVLPLLIHGVKL